MQSVVDNLLVSPLEKALPFSKQLSITNRLVSAGTLGPILLLHAGISSGLNLVQVLFMLSKSLCTLALLIMAGKCYFLEVVHSFQLKIFLLSL